MGEVTIDSIQIEIESSSTNAAKGIDALAGSLERLKKNGSFKTVSTNLDNLSKSLKNLPNVHSASNSLRTLANSIEKLKGVGSVASLSNSIAKLPVALKSVSSINLDRVAPQLQRVSDAVYPLTQVKNSGFSSIVNSMAKLKTVTESLKPEVIDAFAEKVKKLNEVVEPFATKMGTIKSAISGMNTQLKQTNVTLQQTNEKVNVSVFNISNMINVFNSVKGAIQSVVAFLGDVIHQASQWDGIKYQFGNAFGEQADEYYEKITQITDALYINKQAFMENSAMAASMLIGFGVDKAEAREMGLGYTELAYDIWAAYNNVYETLDGADGAMAAVRSAIAGEVEPIRRAGFTIVEATLEQTAANHGLEISLANATEAQKSYLRYLTLVDQAQSKGIVGTYAREMETAEGMMRMLSQQVKSLTQAFGSLFLPILVKVMPYVQAFVELLKDGVFWLANLLGVEIQDIGDTWNDYSSGTSALDGVADSASGATDSLNDATEAAKALKNATLGIDELNVISPTSSSSSDGSGSGSGSGSGGSSGFGDISSLWDQALLDGIQNDVDAIKEKMKGWLPVIATVTTALAGLRLINLLNDMEKIKKLKIVSTFTDMGKGITEFFKAAKQNAPEVGWFAALFPKLSTWLAGLPAALSSAATFLSAAAPYIAIAAAVVGGIVLAFVDYDFTDVGHKIGEKVGGAIRGAGKWLEKNARAFIDWWGMEDWWDVFEIFSITKWGQKLAPEIAKLNDWINDKIENLKGNINEFFSGFFDGFFEGLGVDMSWAEKFVEVFDIKYTDIISAVQSILNPNKIGSDIFRGIVEGIKSGDLFESIKTKFTDFVSKVKEFFGINSPSTLMRDEIGKNLVSGITAGMSLTAIKNRLSSMWTEAKTWWDNKKSALKSYTPSIGNIASKLSTAWTNAKDWWNNKKSAMKTYTPSIGSIYEKVYDRWKNARDWWNGKKGSFKTYTPSIGSITDKLKSAWNSAKSWWNKNVKLSTKLNIQVPTIKVKWETASAFGKSFKYPTGFSLKFAADGGIFDAGSLIWAGERGAEIVANAGGGKTGVMNVQQMQDAVYEGVYAAMSAAMRGNNGGSSSQVIKVYLDGKEITSIVEKTQRERGADIMGNEVYSY